MNQLDALKRIRGLGVPAFETRDVSALLQVTPANASVLLSRLARHDFVQRLTRGRWSLAGLATPERVVEQLAAPWPAYISCQSALFRHGLIEQVPAVVYVVTLGRARQVRTPLGTLSLHQIPAALFGGFTIADDGTKLASAEKALFDLLYLGPTRTRLFVHLPEIEFPRRFRWAELSRWTGKIAGQNRRTFVDRKVAELRSSSRRA